MTMFDRLPRRQINPEAGQYDEVEDGGFFGGLNRMPGLFKFLKNFQGMPSNLPDSLKPNMNMLYEDGPPSPNWDILPDRNVRVPSIEEELYENRFSGPTGGSEYFNFGGNYEPPEGY
jgi:hypothetical protein